MSFFFTIFAERKTPPSRDGDLFTQFNSYVYGNVFRCKGNTFLLKFKRNGKKNHNNT